MNARLRSEPASEAVFLQRLEACHEQARAAMAGQDWHQLGEVARELDAVAGDLNLAMAAGFASEKVDIRLQALIEFLHKALAQARALDTHLRQKEDDLRQERSDAVSHAAYKK